MIKLEIIRSCAISGTHVSTGDSVELEDVIAQELIGMGKAVRVGSNRAIGLKNSDGPKMNKRVMAVEDDQIRLEFLKDFGDSSASLQCICRVIFNHYCNVERRIP